MLSALLSLILIFNASVSASVAEQVTSVENQELNKNIVEESNSEKVEDIVCEEDGSMQVYSGYNTLSEDEKILYRTVLENYFCEDFEEEKNKDGLYGYAAWFENSSAYKFIKNHSFPLNKNKESYYLLNFNKQFKIFEAIKCDFPLFCGLIGAIFLLPPEHNELFEMRLVSIFSKDELLKKYEELNKKVDGVLKNMNETLKENATDLEKAKFIHDYICKNCKYFKYPEEEYLAVKRKVQTAYGCLCEGKAVCEGMARAYQLLMNRAGIDCRTINGMTKDKENGYHAWNIMKIGDTWSHVDVTWDLNTMYNSDQKENTVYNYFNVSNEEIQKDHRIGIPYGNGNDEFENANGFRNLNLPEEIARDIKVY